MAANSSTFSLAGLAQGTVNTVLNAAGMSSVDFKNNPFVQFFLGNAVSTVVYGSARDAGLTLATQLPAPVTYGMGSGITWGRRTSTIMSLNLAGKGGLPQALGSSTAGFKRLLGALGDLLDVIPQRLLVDTALAGAEAAYCAYKTK